MDQRFAIHAERATMLAFRAEPRGVLEVVVDAVDDIEAGSMYCPCESHRFANGESILAGAGAAFLQQVVRAKH